MFIRIIITFFFLNLGALSFAQDSIPAKTGRFEIETTTGEILGQETAAAYREVLDPNKKFKWTIYVPETYNPASPPGVMVYMTPPRMAKIPFGWKRTMEDKNLIWISLNKPSQKMIMNREMLLNILSTPLLENMYQLNGDRIYMIASADSCGPASAAAQIYPNIIKGVIYSTCDPINWRDNTPDTIETMRENRFVFVSSNEKELKLLMRRAVRRYNNAGITKTDYLNIPKLYYGKNIDRRKLNETIDMLDVR